MEIAQESLRGYGELAKASTAGNAWLSGRRFALLLAVLIFAQFPQVLLGLQTFVVRDYGFFAYPLAHFQHECFWRGELPSWNPYNDCGVPFLAQWNTMPFYPPALIYLLLPLTWSLSFFCLVHVFIAGLGMYFLANRWTGNRFAAAVAGILFSFNGLTLNLLMWPSHIATLSWMPWVVLTAESGWRAGGRNLIVAALVGSLQMLAGGPETIFLTWLILALMWLGQVIIRVRESRVTGQNVSLAMIWRFPVLVLLITGLCAAQLLPFLDLTVHSQREVGYADSRWAMPAWGWVNFLVPMAFGKIWSMGVFFQYYQSWTSSYYIAIGGLLLGILGAWSVRSARTWLLAGVAVCGLILSFGDRTFIFRGLRWLVPQLSMITNPVKFITLAIFAVPLLAAYALERMQSGQPVAIELRKRMWLFGTIMLGLIAAILVWARLYPFPPDEVSVTLGNGLERAGFLVSEVGLLFILLRSREETLQRVLPLAFLVILWLDVLRHEPNQNPTVSPTVYESGLVRTRLETIDKIPQPVLGKSRAMLTSAAEAGFTGFIVSDPKNNFLVKRLGYFCNCNLLDDVPKVNGFFSLYPSESSDIISILYGTTAAFPRLLDFLSVSEHSENPKSNESIGWASRDTWLPEITVGQKPIYRDRPAAIAELSSTNFDPAHVVILSAADKPFVTVTNQTQGRVVSSRFGLQEVEFGIEASEPSLAVVSQTYYHLWRATMDNKPARLLRANHAFQALEVPAGTHHMKLTYRNDPFLIGAAITGFALCACAVGWMRYRNASARMIDR
jgi:hypothetical protein